MTSESIRVQNTCKYMYNNLVTLTTATPPHLCLSHPYLSLCLPPSLSLSFSPYLSLSLSLLLTLPISLSLSLAPSLPPSLFLSLAPSLPPSLSPFLPIFLSLDALNPTAYAAFQVSQDLKDVVDRSISNSGDGAKPGMSKSLSIRLSLKTPVKPMLVGVVK